MKVRDIIFHEKNRGYMSGCFSQQMERDVPLCCGTVPRVDPLPPEENPWDFDVMGLICPVCGKVLTVENLETSEIFGKENFSGNL